MESVTLKKCCQRDISESMSKREGLAESETNESQASFRRNIVTQNQERGHMINESGSYTENHQNLRRHLLPSLIALVQSLRLTYEKVMTNSPKLSVDFHTHIN